MYFTTNNIERKYMFPSTVFDHISKHRGQSGKYDAQQT